jgi:hypothetical protein
MFGARATEREPPMFFLVPHATGQTDAVLWAGAADEAGFDALRLVPAPASLEAGPERRWPPQGNPRLRHRMLRLTGLAPATRYRFALTANGSPVAEAGFRTLPPALPEAGDKPFTVLLGSCFSCAEDEEGRLDATYARLAPMDRPDVKILVGDQVYLDAPWQRFVRRTHSERELASLFFDRYKETWGGTHGLRRVLADGANYFTSDDHEFWNNAPNRAAYVMDTWPLVGNRDRWLALAGQLYAAFQTEAAVHAFDVEPLSVMICDTRINRTLNRDAFMRPADLDRLRDWVEALRGPGLLAVGQPLLQAATAALRGHFFDWNLPDYAQYHTLAAILGKSAHSIVVITGDVHYGRIAHSTLRSGAELIEIISSPMSLVDEKARGVWAAAPERFPSVRPSQAAPASLAPTGVETVRSFAPNDRHFLTLEFHRRGSGAALRVRHWPVADRGRVPTGFGTPIWQRFLS